MESLALQTIIPTHNVNFAYNHQIWEIETLFASEVGSAKNHHSSARFTHDSCTNSLPDLEEESVCIGDIFPYPNTELFSNKSQAQYSDQSLLNPLALEYIPLRKYCLNPNA